MTPESARPSQGQQGPQQAGGEHGEKQNNTTQRQADQGGNGDRPWAGRADATRTTTILFRPGDVVELRVLNAVGVRGRGTVSGYFDDFEKLISAAERWDGRASGIYVVMNPVLPALLARAENHCVENPSCATGDDHIVRRRWLLIDIDGNRPSGISATDEEKEAARALAAEVKRFLGEAGFPDPVEADSGNGVHLIYAIDLEADDSGLVQRVLDALAFRFNTAQAKLDQSVFKRAQLTKFYGTLARKGDSTSARPHRRSAVTLVPRTIEAVPRERLEAVAFAQPPKDEPASRLRRSGEALDVDGYLRRHGLDVARCGPWQNGTRLVLTVCPFDSQHADSAAYVLQFPSGALAAGCHHNGCNGKGWHELRDLLEPGWRNSTRSSDSFGSAKKEVNSDAWPDPEPLPDGLPPVMAFDPLLLPEAFRPWIEDIAARVQCPIDYPAAASVIALATAAGRRIAIMPKREDDWMVVPNLWGDVIGRPGILKSPAIREPLRAVEALEREARTKFEADEREYLAQQKFWELKQKKKLSSAIDDCEESGGDPLDLVRKTLENEPKPPRRRRFLTNDSTVEKLGEILNENTNGILVFRDELIGLLRSLDKEGQEGARAFYLEAWNGTGPFTYDRIGRGTIDIEAAIISVFGSIQPGPLTQYLHAAVREGKGDDGLMQRFQIAVYPDISRDWVNVDRWPDSDARARAHEVIKRAATIDPDALGAHLILREHGAVRCLRFSADAQERFDSWRADLERRARSGAEHPAIESHLAKYRSLIPSLALLFHLADGEPGPVGLESLDRAIGWGVYLESHARRIYSVAVNPDLPAARALAAKIRSGALKERFALRDVYRPGWTGLSSRDDAARAVAVLLDLDWLIECREATGGAPKTWYLINPGVHDLSSERTDKSAKSNSGADPDAASAEEVRP